MRIGLVSDSHGDIQALRDAFRQSWSVDMWLHAGDYYEDAEVLRQLTDVPVIAVQGNCDWPGSETSEERIIEPAGQRILLTHGHLYNVRTNDSAFLLAEPAKARQAGIVVFGHTHFPYKEIHDGILILNPGSAAASRDGRGNSFMVLELGAEKEIKVQLFRL